MASEPKGAESAEAFARSQISCTCRDCVDVATTAVAARDAAIAKAADAAGYRRALEDVRESILDSDDELFDEVLFKLDELRSKLTEKDKADG